MSQTPSRPAQVTFAGWLIIGGSIVLVVSAWQRISGLHTLEVQEELRRALAQPPFSGTAMSLDALTTTIRVLCLIGAGAATACAILGYEVMRKRSQSARIALSVLSPFVFVGSFATNGFFGPMVVAGVVMLWMRPARDWLAGRPWATAPSSTKQDPFRPQDRTDAPPSPTAPDRSEEAPTERQPVMTPTASPEDEGPRRPAPYVAPGPPPSPTPYGAPYPPTAPTPTYAAFPATPAKRPSALVAACWVVWIMSGVVAAGMLLTALALATMPDDSRADVFAEMERQQGPLEDYGLTQDDVLLGTYLVTAVVVPWCIVAIVLAVLAFRRVGWARITLVVSAAVAGTLSLAMALASPPLVIVAGACAAVTWLLFKPDVAGWFRR